MDDKKCYNCLETSHYSVNCPQKQLYSRCAVCRNVCFEENGHKYGCSNKSFKSKFLDKAPTDSIVEIESFMQLKLKPVDDIFVCTGNQKKKIGESSLWVPEHSLSVKCTDGILVFAGAKGKSYTIAVNDKNGNRRLKIALSNSLVINNRYSVTTDGFIKYQAKADDAPFGYAHIILSVENVANFIYGRILWKNQHLYLDIHPKGTVLKDPLQMHLQKLGEIAIYMAFMAFEILTFNMQFHFI